LEEAISPQSINHVDFSKALLCLLNFNLFQIQYQNLFVNLEQNILGGA